MNRTPIIHLALVLLAVVACSSSSTASGGGFSPCSKDLATACANDTCYETVGEIPSCADLGLLRGRCDGYEVLVRAGTDTGTRAYYDLASGKLVALTDYSANFGGSETCAGGPSSFTPPGNCQFAQIPAGGDGGR